MAGDTGCIQGQRRSHVRDVLLCFRSISRYGFPRRRTRTPKRTSITPIRLIRNPSEVAESQDGCSRRLRHQSSSSSINTWLETLSCRKGKMTGGKNRRRILIDHQKTEWKVVLVLTLDIDRSLTFDDPDALLQCQWRRQRFE